MLIPILIVLGFRLYVITHSSDIEPVDDTDLLLVRPDIPATNNAYQIFASATNLLYLPEGYDLGGFLWGDTNEVVVLQEPITSVLESNMMLIATLNEGCRKEFCVSTPPLQSSILPREFIQMHLVLLANAKIQMDSGNINEAFESALISLRFGYLVQKDAEYIIDALAGVCMIERSLACIEKITDQPDLPLDKVTELITTLSQLEDLRKGLENGYKSQYSPVASEMIDQLNIVKGRGYIFKPNATKKILAEYWRRQINNLNNPDSVQIQHGALEYQLPKGFIRNRIFLLGENSVGKIFLSLATANDFSHIHKEIYSTETEVSDLKAKLLLKQQQMNGL